MKVIEVANQIEGGQVAFDLLVSTWMSMSA